MQTLQEKTHHATAALLEALWCETDAVRRSMLQSQLASEMPRLLSLRVLDQQAPTLM